MNKLTEQDFYLATKLNRAKPDSVKAAVTLVGATIVKKYIGLTATEFNTFVAKSKKTFDKPTLMRENDLMYLRWLSDTQGQISATDKLRLEILLFQRKGEITFIQRELMASRPGMNMELVIKWIRHYKIERLVRTKPAVLKKLNKDIYTQHLLLNGFVEVDNKHFLNRKGEVYKIDSQGIIKKQKVSIIENNHGHTASHVFVNSKNISIHRLLAIHFVDNPKDYKFTAVVGGDYINPKISKIRWIEKKTDARDSKLFKNAKQK